MSFEPSTFETIDYSLFTWIDESVKPYATTNKGWKKTPIVWVAGERSWQVKDHKNLRDNDGALIFPMITLARNGFAKDLAKKGPFFGNIPPVNDKKGGSITIARQIQQDKTANFANAQSARREVNDPPVGGASNNPYPQDPNFPTPPNKKIVYETITIPMPVYVDVNYEINVRTEYQQQMNEILQSFSTFTNSINYINLKYAGHQYEGFMQQDFTDNNNVAELGDETRIYETKITVKVLGYLVGGDKNSERPHVVRRQNAVEVKIPRERCMLGEIPPWRKGKYRC